MAKGKMTTSSEAGNVYNMSKDTVKKLVRKLDIPYATSRGEYLFDGGMFESAYLDNMCRTYSSKKATATRRKAKRESGSSKLKSVSAKSK